MQLILGKIRGGRMFPKIKISAQNEGYWMF